MINSFKKHSVKFCLILTMVGLVVLTLRPSLVAANPLTAQQRLERAWKLASDIGVYRHRSQVLQTSHPTPRLDNAGRSPHVDRMIISGVVDRPQGEMQLTLAGMGANQPSVEIKVEDGKAYGRQGGDEAWTELEEPADVFDAGGKPLGFLVAVENVQELPRDVQEEPAGEPSLDDWLTDPEGRYPASYTHYTFEIDGRRYAEYMTAQMEAELRRRGELPPSMQLGLADQYLGIKARGEIWLDDEGLPVRQVLHLEFPPERDAYEWYEAEITTSFSGWDKSAVENQLFWAIPRLVEDPSLLLDDPLSLLPNLASLDPAQVQNLGLTFGLSLLLAALALFIITHCRSRQVYVAIVLAVISSMLITPLLQSGRALAFSKKQAAKRAAYEQQQINQQAAEQLQANLLAADFDPQANPLTPVPAGAQPAATSAFSPVLLAQPQADCPDPVPGDADCDGDPDNDGDGLTDEVEVLKLGTDPDNIDTDGDYLSDKVEVEGFDLNGQQWYLDPTNPDSNNDGTQDFFECTYMVDINTDGTPITQTNTFCENADGDTTPDVFDFDDDNDGVPDRIDTAPTFTGSLTTDPQSSLLLDLSNYSLSKTLLIDLQLRPANPDNLWQYNNVLDWPDDDRFGQITRVFTTTFADFSSESNPLPELWHGDVMLTPILEIKLPAPISNTLNPAASLPISPTFSGDITNTPVSEWLDTDTMDQYAIVVKQDQAGDPLSAYVPLVRVEDSVGDTPVAWGARMVYRPEEAAWGLDHEMRLLWMVTALVDTCDTSGMPNPDDPDARTAWCEGTDHWTTETSLIQTYYEDFNLTGLDVTEDHGVKTAVIAQTDALTATQESHLWQLSRGLQSSFIVGDLITDTPPTRFAIEEIKQRFDKDTTPYNTGDPELWDIPDDKIIVWDDAAVDQAAAFSNLQTIVPNLLGSAYSDAVADDHVTLMFARQDASRSARLEERDLVSIDGNAISVNMSDTLLSTHAALNWAPYQYNGTRWRAYDAVDYVLDDLEPALRADLTLTDLHTIAAGETIRDESVARNGAVLLAQNYYLTLHRGLANLVEVDGVIFGEDVVNDGDFGLDGQKPVALIAGDIIDLAATLIEVESEIVVNGETVADINLETDQLRSLLLESVGFGKEQMTVLIGDAASQVVGVVAEWRAKKLYKRRNNFKGTSPTWGKWSKRGGSILGLASLGIALGGPALGMDERTAMITAGSLTAGAESLSALGAYSKVHLLRQLKGDFGSPNFATKFNALKRAHAIRKVVKAGAFMGLVVESTAAIALLIITLTTGHIRFGSIQGHLLFSETIGQIVVAIIAFFISLVPGGALLVGILAIFDALLGLYCELKGVDPASNKRRWLCGGVSGAIASGVSYLIYDFYIPYDVNDPNRLNIAYDLGQLLKNTETDGFVAGNAIQADATISNTIILADPQRVIIKTSYLKPNLELDRERLKDIGKTSTFTYSLNLTQIDPSAGLSLGGTIWQGDTAVFSTSRAVTLTEGVNSIPDIYLTEAYDLAVIECWGFVGADENATCREDKELKGASNTHIGKLFIFDVLPTTIDEIPDFFRAAQPDQLDADGDGLLSAGSGLVDPDDTTWDTDADGLSDYWEMNRAGFDAQDPDSDDDGLYDYWEAFYQTRPDLQDSDFEGLPDGQEFFHSNARHPYGADNATWSGGWTVVYDYSDGQSLQTLVSADPLKGDSDRDTILDSLEWAYGYHPLLSSEVNVLKLRSEPDGEYYAPGSTINYTATVKNELDNRVAYGLLEAEFPVDVVQEQQVINALYPQMEADLSGSVTVPNANQSLVRDLVVRAGALIGTTAVDEVFVLPFEDAAGSTTFVDATSARRDFGCTACPTANGGTVTFNGTQVLTRAHDTAFDLSSFSLSAWVKPAARGGLLYDDLDDFTVEQLADGTVQVTVEGASLTSAAALALDRWNYLVVAYDAGSVSLFVNSIESASGDLGGISPSSLGIEVGGGLQADLDQIALHSSALTREDILDVFNGLTLYASFDDGVYQPEGGYCGFADAISQRAFDCDRFAYRHHEWWPGYVDNLLMTPRPDLYDGAVGSSVKLAYIYGEDSDQVEDTYYQSNYLHYNHQFSLAGTTPGENDNAFSIAMWLHATSPKPGGRHGAILTLPDQPGTGGMPGYTNPTWYEPRDGDEPGDGELVRVEAGYYSRSLTVTVGSCSAYVEEFMYKGHDIAGIGTLENPPGNHWQHLVIAYNGQNQLNLYQNGDLISSTPCFATQDFRTVDGFTLGFSSLSNEVDIELYPWTFAGYVDELRFYNRSFSEAEARELYYGTNVKFDFNGRTGQTFFQNDAPGDIFGACSGGTCPTSGLPGLDNQALYFDGGDYVELSGDTEALGLKDSSFTLMGWVKGDGGMLGVLPDGDGNWLFAGLSAHKPAILWEHETGPMGTVAPAALSSDQWNHVAFRYQKNDDEGLFLGQVSIYVNGALVTSRAGYLPFDGDGMPYLGQTYAENFGGMLDNVVMVRYALTEAEIQAYMNQAPAVTLHLDEGLENVLDDVSEFQDDGPNQLTATCDLNGGECPVAGKRGQMREAPLFDGDDRLTIPDHDALDLDTFSLGLWVRPEEKKAGDQPLVVKEASDGSARNYGLFIKQDTMTVTASLMQNDCNTVVSVDSAGALNIGQWNHVVMTFDGSQSKIYLNGSLQGSTAYSGTACLNTHPLQIGAKASATAGFEGSLDEVTLHNVALSAQQVRELYAYQLSWYDTTDHHPIFIDAESPQIDVSDPSVYMNTQTRLLSLSAYDLGSGLQSVTVKIKDPDRNVTVQQAISSTEYNSDAWFYTFEPGPLGRYTVIVTATDSVGHSSVDTKYLDVDGRAPYIEKYGHNGYDPVDERLAISGYAGEIFGWGYDYQISGIVTQTLLVDVRDRKGNSISKPVVANVPPDADLWDLNWSVDYPFPAIPYGEFRLYGSVTDQVGNSDGVRLMDNGGEFIRLDAIGPIADVLIDTHVLGDLTGSVQGTATDAGYALTGQQTVFHFEETAGASQFLDGSPGQVMAECASPACPTAGQDGILGRAAEFDGLDDWLDLGLAPAISGTQAFAVSAWVKTNADGQQVILQQRSASAADGRYRLSLGTGGVVNWLVEGEGATAFNLYSTDAVNDGRWHHILAQRKADGSGSLYVDGLSTGVVTATARAILESSVAIGADGIMGDSFFNGRLDEVTMYRGALSEDEIYYLANPLPSTIGGVQVRFRSYDERDLEPDEGTWHTATLQTSETNFATWSLAVPALSPNDYKIDLKATDSAGNQRYVGEAWTGAYLQHDLQLSATTGITQVALGGQIDYTINYTNSANSVSTATQVLLNLVVPADASFNAGLSHPDWACSPDIAAGSLCTWPIGSLLPGAGGVVTATLDVLAQASAGVESIPSLFALTSSGGEQAPDDNQAAVTTPLAGLFVDLEVSKYATGRKETEYPSEYHFDYIITITNTGNQAASLLVTEMVPIAVGVDPFATEWDCNPTRFEGSTCIQNAGVLTAGESMTVPFPLYVADVLTANTTITNTVWVSTTLGDELDLSDNVFTTPTLLEGGVFDAESLTVTVQEGGVVTNTGLATCIGGCEFSVNHVSGPGVLEFNPAWPDWDTHWTWTFTTTDGLDESDDVVLEFEVFLNPSQYLTFAVIVENVAPTIVITGNDMAFASVPYTAALGSVVDPGPDTVTACSLNWGDGSSDDCFGAIGGGTLTHTFTTTVPSRTLTVDLTDEDGLHLAAGSKVVIFPPNIAPVFLPLPPYTIAETETLTFTAVATDANGDTLRYSLLDPPYGAAIDPNTGLFTWVLDEESGPGVYGVTLVASDASLSATATIPVTVTEVNRAPLFGPPPDTTVDEGATLKASFAASDADLPTQMLSFSLDSGPAGATVDPDTGLLTWTPGETDGPSQHPATVLVSDGALTASQSVDIIVNEVNLAPALAPIPEPTVIVSDTVTFTATATDPDVPSQNLTYSLGNAPAGATIDPVSGQFSWVTDAVGLYAATIIVSDGVLTDSYGVPIIVKPPSTPPEFFPIAEQTIPEDILAVFAVEAYDVNGDTLTYTLGSGPAGAFITPTTGIFTWQPDEYDGPGVHLATVLVSDGTFTSSQLITITVREINAPPIFAPIGDQAVVVGETFNFTVVVTDVDVPTQSLRFGLAQAPAGASIDPNTGLFNWATSVVGAYSTTITVSDGVLTNSQTISLTVAEPGYILTLNLVGQGAVSRDPDQPTYPAGTVVTLTAIPAPDWSFVGWSGDLSSPDNPATITMTRNMTITANFDQALRFIYLPVVIKQ